MGIAQEILGMKDSVNAVNTGFGGSSPDSVAFARTMCNKMGAAFSQDGPEMAVKGNPGKGRC